MLVLGLDPSLRHYGWAVHDTEADPGPARCVGRGTFQTTAASEAVDRYVYLRERVAELIQHWKPDKVGSEAVIFQETASEALYALYIQTSEAVKAQKQDLVLFNPSNVKIFGREILGRPKGWDMKKPEMVEAAKAHCFESCDRPIGHWRHDEADAYLVSVMAGLFWKFHQGLFKEADLSPYLQRLFARKHTFIRGKRKGQTEFTGIIYREGEKFFRWSQSPKGNVLAATLSPRQRAILVQLLRHPEEVFMASDINSSVMVLVREKLLEKVERISEHRFQWGLTEKGSTLAEEIVELYG